jgi:predicted DCC family thiol-disulfide oxidoreductase YuxK
MTVPATALAFATTRTAPVRTTPADDTLVVLFDRDCGFCQWTVRQLRPMDRRHRLRFVSLQDVRAGVRGVVLESVARDHPLDHAIHVVDDDGTVRAGGRAMLRILDVLPGGRLLRPWAALPGAEPLIDGLYTVLARNRNALGRLVAASDEVPACVIEPLEVRRSA